ncbi:hypothetical protein FHR84_001009 [Actinopolyspora biskrensis]|uniref:Uncharacterized protein n=1 Tax=Actinopolyspora biskrensis TaxID=1470178 RepID=A0A852YXM6_9ACTN|nr:hypothetical protein [Actinopolyspora biskrensis]
MPYRWVGAADFGAGFVRFGGCAAALGLAGASSVERVLPESAWCLRARRVMGGFRTIFPSGDRPSDGARRGPSEGRPRGYQGVRVSVTEVGAVSST